MKLKQKLLLAVIATAFAAPAAFADGATAGQAVNSTVDQVTLVAVDTPTVTISCPAITTAGANLVCTPSTGGVYKFTSNNAIGSATAQTIKATIDSAVPSSWDLKVATGNSATGHATGVLATSIGNAISAGTAVTVVSGIINAATGTSPTDTTITYSLAPVGGAGKDVLEYTTGTDGNRTVTYTLSAL